MKFNKTTLGLIVSVLVNILGVTGIIPPAIDADDAKCPPGATPVAPAPAPTR